MKMKLTKKEEYVRMKIVNIELNVRARAIGKNLIIRVPFSDSHYSKSLLEDLKREDRELNEEYKK